MDWSASSAAAAELLDIWGTGSLTEKKNEWASPQKKKPQPAAGAGVLPGKDFVDVFSKFLL